MWQDNFRFTDQQRQLIRALGRWRPLLVGGCVRDAQMGIEPKDIDIEVHGVDDIDLFVRILSAFGKVDEVGQVFAVFKVAGMDISLPRRETKHGAKHQDFSVEVDVNMSIEEASARRDFTINAMMVDALTDEFIDPHHGARDRFYGILRHTSDAFAEDPLRVLRGVQFAARFGFDFAPETAELCKSLSDQFSTIHPDRIWIELEKLITKGEYFTKGCLALKDSGWDVHFPTLRDNWRIAQKLSNTENVPLILAAMFSEPFGDELGVPHGIRRRTLTYIKIANEIEDIVMDLNSSDEFVYRELRKLARRHPDFKLFDAAFLVPDCSDAARMSGAAHRPIPLNINGDDMLALGVKPGASVGAALALIGAEVDRVGYERSRSNMLAVAKVLLDNMIVKD